MKTNFPVSASATTGGEILTRPATFLPGQPAMPHPAPQLRRQNVDNSAGFCGIFNFNPTNNMMAQPLLKGGLQ